VVIFFKSEIMKLRSIIITLAAIAVLVSFTVVSVRSTEKTGNASPEGRSSHYEPLGGFAAEDPL
jgi:hypothetical protein